MKFATALLSALSAPLSATSLRALLRLLAIFVAAVVVFSSGFHALMALEGREFTWWTSVYWTLVTMTTLGYGDIVFESDLGRMYSLGVLVTGAVLILILLPFTFIQLVYLPWRAAMREARTPRSLPENMSGHVLVTGREPVEDALRRRAEAAGIPAVLLVEDVDEAVQLNEEGHRVLVGDHDDPETYRAARAEHASMLLTARSDQANTNVAFTMREVTDAGIVVATATSKESVDVLELAGCDRVLQLGDLLGRAFARRILAPTARSSVISSFDDLLIAEASAAGTQLVGRTLADLDLRRRFGLSVVGVWARGSLQVARPDLRVEEASILVLAGTDGQFEAYDDAFAGDGDHPGGDALGGAEPVPVLILGGGRVGRAAAQALREAGMSSCIVERREERVRHIEGCVIGDAADREVLERAGISKAAAVMITTHDDDTNLYLTLYCRRLRAQAEILGRVNLDRNLSTMHRAGADFVLSYASAGATEVWNALRSDSTLLLAEGLVVFRVPVPEELIGHTLRSAPIADQTGCSVIAVAKEGTWQTDMEPDEPLAAVSELVLIGDEIAEGRFFRRYMVEPRRSRVRGWLARMTGSSVPV